MIVALFFGVGLLAVPPVLADSLAPGQMVQAGGMTTLVVAIHNETAADHTYTPALSGLPADVTVTFTQGGPVLEQAAVAANSAALVTVRVQTTPQTPVGAYTADFTATRDDGNTERLPVTLLVEKTFALEIVSQSLNVSAFSGQDFSFDVTAANTGAGTITNGALHVDAPSKWIVVTDPASVASVDTGTQMAFHVTVSVPASQVSGDHTLKLVTASDQTESPAAALSVRVQKSPGYLLYAAGVMLLAVTGAYLYFRANGRR